MFANATRGPRRMFAKAKRWPSANLCSVVAIGRGRWRSVLAMSRGDATVCKICGSRSGTSYTIRELMFGSGRPYNYVLCAGCGCMQLVDGVPASEQYPPQYYAHQPAERLGGMQALIRRWRNGGVFRGTTAGRALAAVKPYTVGGERWIPTCGATRNSRILDVGCGTGNVVYDLRECGFTQAEGIDPYLPSARPLPPFIRRASMSDISGEYDVIMLHHVLEHLPDQDAALRDVARLLARDGVCLVRIPVLPNAAWEQYGENWVQLDAPRHHFIHSTESLQIVARRAGLVVRAIEYDSTEFQFTGSELYAQGRPLSELAAASPRERRAHRARAMEANRAGRGDQAAFYLAKAG